MGQNFIGEIKMIAFTFAPKDWAYCDGTVMTISQNASLYSLIGTQFGGDGRTTFNLPEMRGRSPMHPNFSTFPQGYYTGFETVVVTQTTMPKHTHTFKGTTTDGSASNIASAGVNVSAGGFDPSDQLPINLYDAPASLTQLHPSTCSPFGSGRAHNNLQPSLVVGFVMALDGLYPSRN